MPSFKGFIIGKGLARYTGNIMADKSIISKKVLLEKRTIGAEITTTAVVQFTPAQLLSGLIIRDPNGSGRNDKIPSAADLVAALGSEAFVGASFEFVIRNTSNDSETITVTADSGDTTISGTATIANLNSKRFLLVVTNVTPASEAYTIYSLGTVVH